MNFSRVALFCFFCGLFICTQAPAQQAPDSLDILDKLNLQSRSKFLNNIFQDAVNAIRRDPFDTLNESQILIEKSEERFKKYEGRFIRYIYVQRFGFERSFTDTSSRIVYIGTKILNSLHTDTREFVIRQNLFIKEGERLNSYKLADNERYLRSLDFIQDARIVVDRIRGNKDSVDILIITKDLFTLTGKVNISSWDNMEIGIGEANLAGMGQRMEATGLWNKTRTPQTGFELVYSKANIGGSFVNGTVGYSRIDGGSSRGFEDENAFFIRLDRPLVSPYSRLAGGMELSINKSENVYRKPDSIFYNYRYYFYDLWGGINLSAYKTQEKPGEDARTNRYFLSARYFKTDFRDMPFQTGNHFDPVYNSSQAFLAQLTLFKQDFYKLNYIYGFGTTEDLPTGFSISLTGGWHRQLDLNRPYGGFQAEQFLVTPRGGFINAVLKGGGFLHNKMLEDAGFLANVNFFTRLYRFKNWKFREYMKFNFTRLNNRLTYEPLRINNEYGLTSFEEDSAYGDKRISIYAESILYMPRKLLGFHFAPFIFGDFSMISPEGKNLGKADIYTGVGGGLRTRNENLIFGTIEFKAVFFPRTINGMAPFMVMLSSDLKYRYKAGFIHAPDLVNFNRNVQ